jgi:excisionase family DNA binding protein
MSDPPPALSSQTNPLLDLGVVASRLGVSLKTVRRMVERRELAVHRIGRLLKVSEADLHSYIVGRRQRQSR